MRNDPREVGVKLDDGGGGGGGGSHSDGLECLHA